MDIPNKKKQQLFHTTKWTLISQMKNLAGNSSKHLREELFRDYWQPIFLYINSKVRDHDKAIDLTQEFFIKCIIEKNLFEKADRCRGKFRTLLISALKNFIVSEHRYSQAAVRCPENEIFSLDNIKSAPQIAAPSEELTDDQAFNFNWIQSMLINVSNRVEEYYIAKRTPKYWQAFNLRILSPILSSSKALTIPEICNKIDINDPEKVSDMIQNVRRKFRKELRKSYTRICQYRSGSYRRIIRADNFS